MSWMQLVARAREKRDFDDWRPADLQV